MAFKGASIRTVSAGSASSNIVTPSRQLGGGFCLDHLKADGWAETHCCSSEIEEVALLLEPRHRWRQMDWPVLTVWSEYRYPKAGSLGCGGGLCAIPRWAPETLPSIFLEAYPLPLTTLLHNSFPGAGPLTAAPKIHKPPPSVCLQRQQLQIIAKRTYRHRAPTLLQ